MSYKGYRNRHLSFVLSRTLNKQVLLDNRQDDRVSLSDKNVLEVPRCVSTKDYNKGL